MTEPKMTQEEIDNMIDAAEGRYVRANCKHEEIFFMGVVEGLPFGRCLNCNELRKINSEKIISGGIID